MIVVKNMNKKNNANQEIEKKYLNQIKNFLKNNILWIISFFLFLIFMIMAKNVLNKQVFAFDDVIYKFIHSIESKPVTSFFHTITHLAGGYILIGICILVLLFNKNRIYFYIMSLNLLNTVIFNQVLKLIFARERPSGIAIIKETGFSFPSGHSMASMSFYGLLIYLIYRSDFSKKWKTLLIVILSTLIFLIGISRIYLGVHYVSDVIAGFCLSVSYLIIFTRIIEKYIKKGVKK